MANKSLEPVKFRALLHTETALRQDNSPPEIFNCPYWAEARRKFGYLHTELGVLLVPRNGTKELKSMLRVKKLSGQGIDNP